jgi:3-oxoacyl-[acyl-carrier-protein] synthase-3
MLYNAGIIGIGSYVPEKILTNQDLEKIVDTNDEWIVSRTGMKERRIAADSEAASDISIIAAQRAIESAGINGDDIDLIIECTVTPDMMFPATAAILQDKLQAKNAAAFDLSAGCTGFIYGITVATQFIRSGFYKNVLVVGCDVLSKITDFTDRNTCVLFGDGAGAAVISRTEKIGIIDNFIGADGSGGGSLTLPAGNSRMPASHKTIDEKLHFTQMQGKDVFKFAVTAMPKAVNEVLNKAGYQISDIDCLIPHQANIRIIDSAVKKLGINTEKVTTTIEKYGNMSSASIPVTLDHIYKDGKLKKGDKIVLVGFGAGLTYGATLLEWLL